jgi:hypothetical protein
MAIVPADLVAWLEACLDSLVDYKLLVFQVPFLDSQRANRC